MLKNINPILNADVLYALRAMGHGDDLVIADTNFPSDSVARETVLGEVLRIESSAAEVVRAVLSLYPLDTFVDDAAGKNGGSRRAQQTPTSDGRGSGRSACCRWLKNDWN